MVLLRMTFFRASFSSFRVADIVISSFCLVLFHLFGYSRGVFIFVIPSFRVALLRKITICHKAATINHSKTHSNTYKSCFGSFHGIQGTFYYEAISLKKDKTESNKIFY